MVTKRYDWLNGATLDEHSKRKHKILREYFFKYLNVRCQIPQQQEFRLAIVDGFAGGGRYKCGTAGSPILFIEELQTALTAINLRRESQGLGTVEVECLLLFNDSDPEVIELLKSHCAPVQAACSQNTPKLHIQVQYLCEPFEVAYPKIKTMLQQGRYRNILFNLDQSGHKHVERATLFDIMRLGNSVEIFYTFAITALLSFLEKSEPERLAVQLQHLQISQSDLNKLKDEMSTRVWLGTAERVVYENFKNCAPYVSPFSINNPDGWRYWLIHFANFYRARQVYNNILHDNASSQAHFGRSGLNMLSYDPSHDGGSLYLFDVTGRENARRQLLNDIPRLISDCGDALGVEEFYEGIYNLTPAHTDDIHSAIAENPDLEVITPSGGARRKANTISVGDVIKLKKQKSFFPMFLRQPD